MSIDWNCVNTAFVERGVVVSMMKPEGAVFETYKSGDRVQTFAFVNGLPMPYSVFAYAMGERMAPRCTAGMGVTRLPESTERDLKQLWRSVALPPRITSTFDGSGIGYEPTQVCRQAITELFNHLLDGTTCDTPSFVKLVRQFDEDYRISLIEPAEYHEGD